MAKREKFSIWGREPDTKKGCYKFYQDKKKTWPIGHVLNEEDKKYMLEMMNKNYRNKNRNTSCFRRKTN